MKIKEDVRMETTVSAQQQLRGHGERTGPLLRENGDGLGKKTIDGQRRSLQGMDKSTDGLDGLVHDPSTGRLVQEQSTGSLDSCTPSVGSLSSLNESEHSFVEQQPLVNSFSTEAEVENVNLKVKELIPAPLPERNDRIGVLESLNVLVEVLFSCPLVAKDVDEEMNILYREEIAMLEKIDGVTIVNQMVATSVSLKSTVSLAKTGREVIHWIGGGGLQCGGVVLETNIAKPHFLLDVPRFESKKIVVLSAHGLPNHEKMENAFLHAGAAAVIRVPRRNHSFLAKFYRHLVLEKGFVKRAFELAEENETGVFLSIHPSVVNENDLTIDVKVLLTQIVNDMGHGNNKNGNLPPPVHGFHGRVGQVREIIEKLLSKVTPGVLLSGLRQSGKSALGVHAMHFALERGLLFRVHYVDCSIIPLAYNSDEGMFLWMVKVLSAAFQNEYGNPSTLFSRFCDEMAQGDMKNLLKRLREKIASKMIDHCITRICLILHDMIKIKTNDAETSCLFLDNCDSLIAFNSFLPVMLGCLRKYSPMKFLLTSCFRKSLAAKPAQELQEQFGASLPVESIHLEQLTARQGANLLMFLLHERPLASLESSFVKKLHDQKICYPSVVMKLSQIISREADMMVNWNVDPVTVVIGKLWVQFEDETYGLVESCLRNFTVKEHSASGVAFWKAACRMSPMDSKLLGPALSVSWDRFKKQLQLHFARLDIPGNKARPLSDQTVDIIGKSLHKVSPLAASGTTATGTTTPPKPSSKSGATQKLYVHLPVFMKRFWPWWANYLNALKVLGNCRSVGKGRTTQQLEPIWARRVNGRLPVIWIDSRKNSYKRMEKKRPGMFTIRCSESTLCSFAIDYINPQTTERGSLLATMNIADGSCTVGKRTFPSLSHMILENDNLLAIFAGTGQTVPKESIFFRIN